MDRIYESNMSKLVDGKPVKNEFGKVIKPPTTIPLTSLILSNVRTIHRKDRPR